VGAALVVAVAVAVVVVVASAAAHLAKGLDFEESTISFLLLVALVHYRRRFDVPGDPASVRPLLTIALGGLAAAAATLGLELRDLAVPEDLVHVFWAVGLVVGFYALFLWLRPLSQVVAQTVGERRLARELVETYGHDSLSFFSLRHDKSFFFSRPVARSSPTASSPARRW
jgi:phosphatidylglycerol lysyltransferase